MVPAKTVAGRAVTPSTSDLLVLQLAADFRSRSLWTTFGTGGASIAGGVALGAGIAAVVGVQAAESALVGPLVSERPVLPPKANTGYGGSYLTFWPAL